jgi:hypothetical protein
MKNRIRLPWKRHLKGYEIIHFPANSVNFKETGRGSIKALPFGSLPRPMPILPDDYGVAEHREENDRPLHLFVITPVGNVTEDIDPTTMSPNLYLEFSNTACSAEGVIEFASEYGLLTASEEHETVDMWCYHIRKMHHAILMWNHVQHKKPKTFSKIFRDHSPTFEEGLKYLLEPVPTSTSTKEDRLQLILEPTSLLASMWFQFAGAIDGATSFAPCVECSAWIDQVVGSNRPDKTYCSDACRQRAYRKRIAEKAKK